MSLPRYIAERIYNVLAVTCDAPQNFVVLEWTEVCADKERFVEYLCEDEQDEKKEWRFGGNLGATGKFSCSNQTFWVDCDNSDKTEKRKQIINRANKQLEKIYKQYLGER